METSSVEKLKNERIELRDKRRSIVDDATINIDKKIGNVDEKLREIALEASKSNADTFRLMAIKTGEMFKMAFELYTIKGIDLHLQLTNHVEWIEINGESYRFCDYDRGESGELIPQFYDNCEFNEAYEIVVEKYQEAFNIQ